MAKLKKKTFFNYTGKVHDLTVENSHTYNVEGKAVHNSAAGSLVAYVLGVTNLDPMEYDLSFERFLNPHRCLNPETLVKTEKSFKKIKDLEIGDLVVGGSGSLKKVNSKFISKAKRVYRFRTDEGCIECSENHLWIVVRDDKKIEVQAKEILITDELLSIVK